MRIRACVRADVHVCVCVRAFVRACLRMYVSTCYLRACVRAYARYVERGGSVVECLTRNRESPGSNPL